MSTSEESKAKKEKKAKKNVPAKGERGYIKFRKQFSLIIFLGLLLVASAIFVAGLFLNDFNKGNIFTVIAILFVLPMARLVTYLILMFPFRDASPEDAEEAEQTAKPGSLIYTSLVATSNERAMGIDICVITGTKVLMYVTNKHTSESKVQDYFSDLVKRKGFDYKVTVTSDRTRFFNLLKASDSSDRSRFESDADFEAFTANRTEFINIFESVMA